VREIYGTLIERWYVTVFAVVFLWRASRHLGWTKTWVYTAVAIAVGGLAENGSVHVGFPYTRYAFHSALRGKEVFLGDVPLMVPLSYTFMGYFAFAAGRLVASGPWRTRGTRPWHEYLLALILAVWALWLVDPVSRLGDRWFLGELFHYAGPGFWFGLPLGSQAGFAATAAVLVALLGWMTREDPQQSVARWQDHPHLTALTTYHGQLLLSTIVAFALGADQLGGAAVLIWVPAAAMTAVLWSALRPERPVADPAPVLAAAGTAPPERAAVPV
jgi:uncharacterized membrane protein